MNKPRIATLVAFLCVCALATTMAMANTINFSNTPISQPPSTASVNQLPTTINTAVAAAITIADAQNVPTAAATADVVATNKVNPAPAFAPVFASRSESPHVSGATAAPTAGLNFALIARLSPWNGPSNLTRV
jgi:hypothetical protein